MQERPFGHTGLTVAPLGIGSLAIPDDADGQKEIKRLMTRLLDAGCNLIDTAQCYPGSETFIGKHFTARRDEFILISKCGHHDVLPDGSMRSRKISMDDINSALARLQTDYLDAMLLHSYDMDMLEAGDALKVLDDAKRAGKVKFAGYSGDNERALFAAKHPVIDMLELSINIADHWNIEHVLPLAQERDLAVIAKRPIANAAWRLIDNPDAASVHVRPYVDRMQLLNFDPNQYGCENMGELALRFTVSIPGMHCAIASSRSEKNQDANLKAATMPPLEHTAIQRICEHFHTVSGQHPEMDWQSLN